MNWYRSGGLARKLALLMFDEDIDGRFTGGAGSSSSLRVKSMTSVRGRLLEDLETDVEATVEASRDEFKGGVRTLLGVNAWKGLVRFTNCVRVSEISTRSSLSSSDGVGFVVRFAPFVWAVPCCDHCPSGSTVTWSVSFAVDSRMFET